MARKVYEGNVLVMTCLVDTLVRDVVVFDTNVGIAQVAGLTGEDISVEVTGVYEFTGVDAEAVAVGTPMYWDAVDGTATIDADGGTNILIGASWTAKGAGIVALVNVKIG